MEETQSSKRASRMRVFEPEICFLVVLVFATFFSRISALPLRGEETRRAAVAIEMMETSNWIVPRYQNDAFFMSSRPPLQAWMIAACGYLRGAVDPVAIRLPSTLALLAVVLMIYAYSRQFIERTGSFGAAASYATMAQVLELGRLGETDLLFTLCVSASLFSWHAGFSSRWHPMIAWTVAYTFVALGTLTKGLQAPVYFASSVGLYLLWIKQPGIAFSWAHGLGIVWFLAIWNCWQIPYFQEVGFKGIHHVYWGDVAMYGKDRSLKATVVHLVKYPIEILFGCMLPWSVLLFGYVRKSLLQRLGNAGSGVAFCVCCIASTFPTVWFVTQSRPRFYMPLYPCFAILIGIVIQRTFDSARDTELRKLWTYLMSGVAIIVAGLGVFVFGNSWFEQTLLAQPLWIAAAFCVFGILCGAIIWKCRAGDTQFRMKASIGTFAVFLGGIFSIVSTNTMMRLSIDKSAEMADLRARIPAGAKLHSLDEVNHAFRYYFGEPIERYDALSNPVPAENDLFCFRLMNFPQPELLPYTWKLVGVIGEGRNQGETDPKMMTVVGQRISVGEKPTAEEVIDFYQKRWASASNRLSGTDSVLR